jgi:Peptidase family M23
MRRALLASIVTFLAAAAAGAAPARVPTLVFPVVGDVQYRDDFGEPRGGLKHQGNDILAARKAPAVAAEGGTVSFWTASPSAGCMLYLHGDSGTDYWYIHLNNDLGSGNDNRGKCVAGTAYAPGLHEGDRVEAGQLVGFVGDSGDANGIHPHLHFEVHPNRGRAVSPYAYLRRATPLLFYRRSDKVVELALEGTVVAAGDGELRLRVMRVGVVGAKRATTLPRTVVVSLTDSSGLAIDAGTKATVYTEPTPATLEAQRGETLTVASVVPG